MKTLISIISIATALFIGTTQAAQVNTAGKALTMCKTEAKTTHQDDFVRAKSTRIKEVRGGYQVKLKVSLQDSTVNYVCDVNKNGSLEFALR